MRHLSVLCVLFCAFVHCYSNEPVVQYRNNLVGILQLSETLPGMSLFFFWYNLRLIRGANISESEGVLRELIKL